MEGTPAFETPPHVLGAGGVRGWFTEPPGAILQFSRPTRGTVEMAEWTVTTGLARLRGRFHSARDLILVMDLSLMEGRDPAARGVMLDKARDVRGMFARIRLVPPLQTTTIYLGTLHAAVLLLKAMGIDVKLAKSLAEAIAEFQLQPASPLDPSEPP